LHHSQHLLQVSHSLAKELIRTCLVVSIFFFSGSLYTALTSWILWWLGTHFCLLPFLLLCGPLDLHRTRVIELLTFHTFFFHTLDSSRLPRVCCLSVAVSAGLLSLITLFVLGWTPLRKLSSKLLYILTNFHVAYLKSCIFEFEQLWLKTVSNPISC